MQHRLRVMATLACTLVFNATALVAQGRRAPHFPSPKPAHQPKPPKAPPQEKPNGEHNAAPLEQFQKMSASERERELAKLPADRREKLERQLERYDRLTPAQKEQLEWFNHLPPERQQSFRQAFQKFQTFPPERKQVLKEELNRLRSMPEAERAAWLSGQDFRSRFSPGEQQILSDMAVALPRR